MTYRELLELYKKNELEERVKEDIETDIEKQEAISDYLYEKAEILELEASLEQNAHTLAEKSTEFELERDFTKMVNRRIRRAFIKMGAVICAVILIIIMFVQLTLPKIVSSFYYNPGKKIAENTNQISLDMSVYTTLTMPGYIRDNISVENNGYGNYDICIYQNSSYNGTFTNLSGTIEKGKLTLYDVNVLKRPPGNAFAWFQKPSDSSGSLTKLVPKEQSFQSAAGSPSEATERLQSLADNTNYVAYVTLDKQMEYEDFANFASDLEDLHGVWCAIRTRDDGVDNIGFPCILAGSTMLNWNREAYPNLLLWDNVSEKDGNTSESEDNMMKEDFMTLHFTSMLRYMTKQKKFLSLMKENTETFSSAAEYVEKNGLTVYGFSTLADKKTLLKLNELEEVYEIYTQPLK